VNCTKWRAYSDACKLRQPQLGGGGRAGGSRLTHCGDADKFLNMSEHART